MSKPQWIMVLALLVIILLFLGFPATWNKIGISIVAVIIIAISYRTQPRLPLKNTNMSFVEHKSPAVSEKPVEDIVCALVPEPSTGPLPLITGSPVDFIEKDSISGSESPEKK